MRRATAKFSDMLPVCADILDLGHRQVPEFVLKLCQAYYRLGRQTQLFKDRQFFGLRDFYNLLRYIKRHEPDFSFSDSVLLWALCRNFNGVSREEFVAVAREFFSVVGYTMPEHTPSPVHCLSKALHDPASTVGSMNGTAGGECRYI